jgi:hypothetical protein
MAGVTRIPRSRGGVSGVLLILLGAWGALAPFVGPYFHFAYTPDRAWAYNSGRLWLSVVPGVAALVGGLLVTFASHRAVGIFGALLAALGGAWFIVGAPVIKVVVVNTSITPGTPLVHSAGSISVARWEFLEGIAFFTGIGVLILFFGALALGRFAVVGVRDAALAEDLDMSQEPAGEYAMASSAAYTAPDSTFPGAGSRYSGAGSDRPSTTQTQPAQAPTQQAKPPSDLFPPTTGPSQKPPGSDTGPSRQQGF